MKSIYNQVMELVESEKTNISKRAFEILNGEGIADIVEHDGIFWFESYVIGNDCPGVIHNYLKQFIKRKMGLNYLYDIAI